MGIKETKERLKFLKSFGKNKNTDKYNDLLNQEEISYLKEHCKFGFNKAHAVAYAYYTFFHAKSIQDYTVNNGPCSLLEIS